MSTPDSNVIPPSENQEFTLQTAYRNVDLHNVNNNFAAGSEAQGRSSSTTMTGNVTPRFGVSTQSLPW